MSFDRYILKIISFCIIIGAVFYFKDLPVEDGIIVPETQQYVLDEWFSDEPIHLLYSYICAENNGEEGILVKKSEQMYKKSLHDPY